jgi:hypothetical protein
MAYNKIFKKIVRNAKTINFYLKMVKIRNYKISQVLSHFPLLEI